MMDQMRFAGRKNRVSKGRASHRTSSAGGFRCRAWPSLLQACGFGVRLCAPASGLIFRRQAWRSRRLDGGAKKLLFSQLLHKKVKRELFVKRGVTSCFEVIGVCRLGTVPIISLKGGRTLLKDTYNRTGFYVDGRREKK